MKSTNGMSHGSNCCIEVIVIVIKVDYMISPLSKLRLSGQYCEDP